jgi:hypothetical protein
MNLSTNARRFCLTAGLFVLATVTMPAAAGSGPAQIERQRELFRDVYNTVERGDWTAVEGLAAPDQQLLEQYVLWPDRP